MSNWNEFEDRVFKYISKLYKNDNIDFELKGGSNSKMSDILVYKNNKEAFFIEIKMSNAQSGQFVVLDDGERFYYSLKNKYPLNKYSKLLIKAINRDYILYKNVGTKSISIKVEQEIFSNWIIEYYKSKNVKYIATEYNNKYIIFPIDRYGFYFQIKANLRRKKSGSSNLPYNMVKDFENFLKEKFKTNDISIVYEDKKAYLYTSIIIENKLKISDDNNYYQIKFIKYGKYLIKKLSNTSNPSIIFSINSNLEQQKQDLEEFEEEFK